MKKILILVNNGFEDVETIIPYDFLKRAGYKVQLASNTKEVTSSHNLKIQSDFIINNTNYKDYDLIVLPGGRQYIDNQKDALYLEIINYYIKNKALACICATPTILGKNNLLSNYEYTCFTPMNEDFGGKFTNDKAIISKNLITGRSAGTAVEFAFKIVEYLDGIDKVNDLKKDLLY